MQTTITGKACVLGDEIEMNVPWETFEKSDPVWEKALEVLCAKKTQ